VIPHIFMTSFLYFQPNLYRLSQLSQTAIPQTDSINPKKLFQGVGRRNRLEYICDFPLNNDAEVISYLEIHPDGHSVLSRNNNNDELSEVSDFIPLFSCAKIGPLVSYD